MAKQLSAKMERALKDQFGLNFQRDAQGNVIGQTEDKRDWGKFAKNVLKAAPILAAPAAIAALPGVAAGSAAAGAGAGGAGAVGAGTSLAGSAGGFLKDNWKDVVGYGLGAADLISSSAKQGEANDLQRQAIEMAMLDREERAPLRDAFIPNATRSIASAPDLGYLRDSGNPFSRARPSGASPHVASQLSFGSAAGPAGGMRDLQAKIQGARLPQALPEAPAPAQTQARPPEALLRSLRTRRAV